MTDAVYQWQGQRLLLRLKVQARASRDEFAGVQGDVLKLRITAPPVDGKANAHIIAFMAKQFAVARRDVTILSGETGRDKRIAIENPARIPADLDIQRP